MTLKEWSAKTAEEARQELARLQEELFHLRLKKVTGQLEKVHQITHMKRAIARGLTYLRRK